ncbi:P-loop containing nucleoside triphosphate hydrolase protein [Durotheca rogersii]|uniref:P-loop containing nucleoside triphosphate hydrolase protein n=1 Tax=Durotheca rogersii TaxID=419775 RepID=UPI00221ED060|nr:P-loop containing nucleoside triphosphate hydrolase protein [Durotheca rogersii]KAI5857410.1 P-loop containing nucleoside triphosphate hydrolase protein [Durotheca rogersii]
MSRSHSKTSHVRTGSKSEDDISSRQLPSLKHVFAFTTRRHFGPLAAGLVAALFSGALKTSLAILMGRIFAVISNFGAGRLAGPETVAQVSYWCVVLVSVGGLGWLVNFAFMFCWIVFSEIQARDIRIKLFKALLDKDMGWFDCQVDGVASLLVRMQTQTRELQMASSIVLGSLSEEIATLIANLAVAFYGSWKLTLVLMATVPLATIVLRLLTRNLKSAMQAQKQALGRASKYAISAITAIDLVKVFDGVDNETLQYLRAIRQSMRRYLIQARANAYQIGFTRFWIDSMFVIGFYYGAYLVDDGLSPGNIITTFYATLAALQAIQSSVPMYTSLVRGMSAGQALYFIAHDLENGRRVLQMMGGHRPRGRPGDIEISDVSFAYPSNPSTIVLRNSSFFFGAGKLYFVIGRSGSGKSTLGNLLVKFYKPLSGSILVGGHSLETLDVDWVRSNVTLVQQTSVLFNDTFMENIAMGRKSRDDVSRADIMAACETALLQSTIASLPNGLDTYVGAGGHNLSGGQKQRLALARARLRDPPILILDEITSGLDPVSRNLIMDAIRQWRQGKTTIIITHEVAQIKDDDFVYVMDDARVVQQGFRKDLQRRKGGMFSSLASLGKDDRKGELHAESSAPINFAQPWDNVDYPRLDRFQRLDRRHDSRYLLSASLTRVSNMMTLQFLGRQYWDHEDKSDGAPQNGPLLAISSARSRVSTSEVGHQLFHGNSTWKLLRDRGNMVQDSRTGSSQKERQLQMNTVPAGDHQPHEKMEPGSKTEKTPLWMIYKTVWPVLTWREKLYVAIGLLMCIVAAGTVPAFSVVFANLLSVLYEDGDRKAAGLKWALYLLVIASMGAVSNFFSLYLMQLVGQSWINALRMQALDRVLRQPKVWFDNPTHSANRINECLDRNAEEMRNIIGRFAPLLLVIVVMIVGSITWALAISWRLTVVTLSSSPLLILATKAYSYVSHMWELRYNNASEDTNAHVTETFVNIRVVRALALERFFSERHGGFARRTFGIGVRKAFWTATLFACWQSMLWFMMALTFWYATKLATQGGITVQAILQVVNLLVIGLTTASNTLNSIPSLTAAQAAATQLLYYTTLAPCISLESKGKIKPPTPFPIRMQGLSFTYPSKHQPTLRNLTLRFDAGTSTAIVGPSGCGKSTIASIILGLYEPDSSDSTSMDRNNRRQLTFASTPTEAVDIRSLRTHFGYVPQAAFLFPASLAANIFYGLGKDSPLRTLDNLERAAREAGIHEFIHGLAAGYDTVVGDGGQALSGGQAQRVCIARALARRPSALILDEPTSALDTESAEAVRHTIETLMRPAEASVYPSMAREGMSVIVVTHSEDMMHMMDRIAVVDEGRVVEVGSYDELLARKGKFTALVNGGVWMDGD